MRIASGSPKLSSVENRLQKNTLDQLGNCVSMIKPTKNIFTFLLAVGLFTLYGLQPVSAGFSKPVGDTVPTRTPTAPTPAPPTAKPPPKKDPPKNQPPPPTSTPVNTPTPTPLPVTIAPTPVGGIVQTDRCGEPYFVANLGTVNVRDEPSVEGEVVAKMVYLEARQVLARAADVSWWQVLLPDTSAGWVFDSTGSMVGIMESVPVINPDGSPADEPVWQPTPDLFCPTLTPSPIPTETATPAPTDVPSATPEPTNTPEPEPTATEDAAAVAEAESESESEEAAQPPTVEPDPNIVSPLPDQVEIVDAERNKRTSPEMLITENTSTDDTTPPTDDTTPPTAGNGYNWPILIGIGLILFGFVALFFQKRQNTSE